MGDAFEPRVGEFVARYTREWNGERFVDHVLVERVTPQTATANGVRYRRPKPHRSQDRWVEISRSYPGLIGPALVSQEILRAAHEEREASAALRSRQRAVENAASVCTDHDRLTRALAVLRGDDAQLLGVEVSDG